MKAVLEAWDGFQETTHPDRLYAALSRLRDLLPAVHTPGLACAECGGFAMQGLEWIELNSGTVIGGNDGAPDSHFWCDICSENVWPVPVQYEGAPPTVAEASAVLRRELAALPEHEGHLWCAAQYQAAERKGGDFAPGQRWGHFTKPERERLFKQR